MAALADETWGTSAGTAWTTAEGADNDWTVTGERSGFDTDITVDGHGRMDNGSSFVSRTHATIDGVTAEDFENQLTWQSQGGSDADGIGLIARRSASDTYYVAGIAEDNSNCIFRGEQSGDGIAIAKVINGTVSVLGESAATMPNNTDYEVKFRIEGTALKVKVWESGTSEPATWDVEVTDSDLTGVSAFGVIGSGKDTDTLLFKNLTTDDLASTADPANLQATVDGSDVTLTWDASF